MIKYSLITGSAGLLGRQHATALLELNYNIVITDIDRVGLEKHSFILKNYILQKDYKIFDGRDIY